MLYCEGIFILNGDFFMRELLEVLEKNSRISVGELASMLQKSEYEIEKDISRLEREKIILSYGALINWERFGDDTVTAVIEINLTPQREVGFDAIAERIYRFDEVRTVYLMSGNFDLLVIIEGKSLKDVANFVATRLSTIEGVTQTRSHFILKPYKKDGIIINDEEKDRRLVVSP
jgi:DNA-binding Lrp family transcriptional regulator